MTRVWGIPCPWDGVDDAGMTWRYRAWFWLYSGNQRVRHLVRLHQRPTSYSIAPRCDWCGHRSAKQRAIAAANWDAMMDEPPTETALAAEPSSDGAGSGAGGLG